MSRGARLTRPHCVAPEAHRGKVDVFAAANRMPRCDARDTRAHHPHGGGQPELGYARIQGALKHLDHRVARSTIAGGLFVTEAWTDRELVRHFTLFFVDITTRRI